MANNPNKAKVDDDAAYHPVCGAGGLPGGTLLPSSKMTITRSMRNSTSECSLPVCNVCAISLPFLAFAFRPGDLALALRAGDLALAAGFRAGDRARPRGFGTGEAARAALRVATIGCKRRGDARVVRLNVLLGQSCVRRRAALQLSVYKRDLYVKALRPGVSVSALGRGGSYASKSTCRRAAAPEINVTAAKRDALATTVATLDRKTNCTTQRRPATRFETARVG